MAGAAHRLSPLDIVVAAIPAVLFVFFLFQVPEIAAGETIRVAYDWIPVLGVQFSFYLDGLSLLFALLISGIGFFIFFYSSGYLAGHKHLPRFYLYLFLFMISMLGLVLADNVFTLFIFWELTTITSFLLIGYESDYRSSRWCAMQALVLTTIGGLALMAGLVLLGNAAGSFELSEINANGEAVRASSAYLPILLLVLLGAFTKSAQVPFHFWLPNAMAAPTPVSAYLHSSTMVKGGVYLLARLQPALGGTEWWLWILMIFGGVTAVWASLLAIRQRDMKLMLAYTTLMALGTLTMLLAAPTDTAVTAAMVFLLVHSLYKASLFLVVGIVDHEAGSRNMEYVRGLRTVLPVTALAACVTAISMAGLPPAIGFIGKEIIYKATTHFPGSAFLPTVMAIAANALMICVAGLLSLRLFFGQRQHPAEHVHEGPKRMWIGPIVMAALSILFGILPFLVGPTLLYPAVHNLTHGHAYHMALWHGFSFVLVLSVITIALGVALYVYFQGFRRFLDQTIGRLVLADTVYDRCLGAVQQLALRVTRFVQHGSLRGYIFTVYLTLFLLVALSFIVNGGLQLDVDLNLAFYEWTLVLVIAAATVFVVTVSSRLAAICALSVSSAGIALLYVIYGAPDVAITQMMVEVLLTVLLAVILPLIPGFRGVGHDSLGGRARDGVLAVGVGGVMSLLMLSVTSLSLDRFMTDFFEASSYPEAHGHNIVNVILVDFRALDTFGEITVVGVAGLACYALLRLRPGQDKGRASAGGEGA